MFTFKDAYASKFYFDRYRVQQKYRFHWHYNILEAVIKNTYISQQVNVHAGNHKIKNILDMGCGNGHVLQFLAQTHRCNAVGFDPKADYKIKLLNSKFNLKAKIRRYGCRTKIYRETHAEFFMSNKIKFDIIIDNCSVTHFDTQKQKEVNAGWDFIAKELPRHLSENGIFISATDVVYPEKVNSEFCKEADILETFKVNGWQIHNLNHMYDSKEFELIINNFMKFKDFDFIRVPPPTAADGAALGVMGMVQKPCA